MTVRDVEGTLTKHGFLIAPLISIELLKMLGASQPNTTRAALAARTGQTRDSTWLRAAYHFRSKEDTQSDWTGSRVQTLSSSNRLMLRTRCAASSPPPCCPSIA